MKITHVAGWLGFLTVLAGAAAGRPMNEYIAVSATAAPDYERGVRADGSVRPESYIFTPGQSFGGGTVDEGLAKFDFGTLVRSLAPGLARQNYFPTRDVPAADLVIVVHWGVTTAYQEPQSATLNRLAKTALPAYRAGVEQKGYADPRDLNYLYDSLTWTEDNQVDSMSRNAVLLGYARELTSAPLQNSMRTGSYQTLLKELSEERYFVILMAYDYQALQHDRQPKLRWVTRLSVRSPGNNFRDAVPVFAQAGAHVFGHQLDSLAHVNANLREGTVSVKDLQVLGIVAAPTPGK